MADNDRTRRTPRKEGEEESGLDSGHGILDRETRRPPREAEVTEPAEQEEPVIRRTQREASETAEEETPVRRTTRNTDSGETRTTIPGNTSETGVGTPTSGGGSIPKLPGKPPVGCSSTTGVLLLTSVAIVVALSKLVRR